MGPGAAGARIEPPHRGCRPLGGVARFVRFVLTKGVHRFYRLESIAKAAGPTPGSDALEEDEPPTTAEPPHRVVPAVRVSTHHSEPRNHRLRGAGRLLLAWRRRPCRAGRLRSDFPYQHGACVSSRFVT